MQKLMDTCTKLYEATGGKVQQEKVQFYCWRWKYVKGEKAIEDIAAELVAHGER